MDISFFDVTQAALNTVRMGEDPSWLDSPMRAAHVGPETAVMGRGGPRPRHIGIFLAQRDGDVETVKRLEAEGEATLEPIAARLEAGLDRRAR
jgi:hypothetical protein